MFATRILVILHPPITAKTAAETIARACASTARPAGLRFAVPHMLEGQLADLPEDAALLYYNAALGLPGVLPHLTDETHFLSLIGPHAFSQRWDQVLGGLWRSCGKRSLLTGSITPGAPEGNPSEVAATQRIPKVDGSRIAALRQALPALQKQRAAAEKESPGILQHLPHHHGKVLPGVQPHLPALKEVLDDGRVLMGRGLALVCTAAPVKTLVADPALLFGPVYFLREMEPDAEALSLAAYMGGYTLYALHAAVLWPLQPLPQQTLRLPPPEALPGTKLARFEQLLGVSVAQRHCSAKAAMGLFGPKDTYPQKLPGSLILNQKLRSARMKLFEQPMPLLVSAFVDLPNPRVASAFYLLRFGFLRRVESLPLLLYTGGSQERALRAAHPHTLSYPDQNLLPKSLLDSGMKPAEYFARSKVHLMQRAAKKQAEFTHIAWVDMDILPHPICCEAVPCFDSMMDDRIHLATVQGIPDPSFIVVPVERLEQLTRLIQSVTQLDAELKRGLGEPILWERLFQRKPEWFAIHRMPRRRLLFLSAFDPQLLRQNTQALLKDLPAPYYATLADAAKPSKPEKENTLHV